MRVRIRPDPNAQTPADVESRSRQAKASLEADRRRVTRFLRALDREFGAEPEEPRSGRDRFV